MGETCGERTQRSFAHGKTQFNSLPIAVTFPADRPAVFRPDRLWENAYLQHAVRLGSVRRATTSDTFSICSVLSIRPSAAQGAPSLEPIALHVHASRPRPYRQIFGMT